MSEHEKTSDPEHVTDEELAEIGRLDNDATPGPWIDTGDAVISDAERDCDDTPYVVVEPYCRCADRAFIAAARTLLPRLAAELRARREDAAAIAGLLNETSVAQYEGETLRARVERLIGQADEESKRTLEALQRLGGARADLAQAKTRAEAAEAELAALRAPVDVEKTLRRLARDIEAIVLESGVTSEVLSLIEGWVRPHVERAARLAREAEGLRAEVYRLNAARVMAEEALDRGRKWHEKRTADLDAARAELAKVVLERDAMAERLRAELEAARDPVDGPEAKLAERTAEIERLRADIARETPRRDDQIAQLERRLGERETEATQYRVAASRAAEVLRTVEWSGVADGGDPGPEPGGCPCCGADKPGPHASTCTLDACLVGSPCADTAALWRVLALARGAIASDEGFTDADLGRTVAQAAEQLRALGHDPDDIWIEPSDAEPITPRGQP